AGEARSVRHGRCGRRCGDDQIALGTRTAGVREAVRCGVDGEDRPVVERRVALTQRDAPAGVAAVPGPSFARGLWRIAAADVSSGNRVTLLRDGASTFDAMQALIDGAERDVCLEGYIFRRDEVGQRFSAALIAAAQRGVRTRVLIDWWGRIGTPRSFFNR